MPDLSDRTAATADVNEIDKPLGELLAWSAELANRGAAAVPEHVLRTALVIACDDLAAMIGAHTEPEVRAITAASAANPAEATLVGEPTRRTGRARAAMANAIAANWCELDGGYRPATCHGSLYTLPSALAEVEATEGTVGDLLTALVLGYEVVTRIARAYPQPLPLARHPHATLSPIGAAAAIASARRLPIDELRRAVLGAASLSLAGPFDHAARGATIRNAWAAAGAQLGFLAVEVATTGLTASLTALPEVFARSTGATCQPEALSEGLGERYAVQDGYQKNYACCQYLHASVEAAARVATRLSSLTNPSNLSKAPISKAITGIEVATHPLAAALGNPAPETTLAGRFSLPHAVATVLRAGGDTSASVFAAESLRDTEVARLRSLVRIEPWTGPLEPPHDRPATVRVTLADGAVLEETVLSAVGGPDRPLSTYQLLDKYAALADPVCPGFAERVRVLTDPDRSLDLRLPLRSLLDHLLGAQ